MRHLLAVNIGSSSLKFSLYPISGMGAQAQLGPVQISGQYEGLEPGGQPQRQWTVHGQRQSQAMASGSQLAHAMADLQQGLKAAVPQLVLAAVSHRIVHSGSVHTAPVVITPEVLATLDAQGALAPLHQPHNLAGVRACLAHFPGVPQIGCFDTAFHATQPDLEQRFALPQALYEQGIRRYGFHGLSYTYVAEQLARCSPRGRDRVLMAHLGNGASLCAARDGRSQATTMGFSALDGLMMGTRSGSIDPGVLLHLMDRGWDAARISHLLYKQSGLLGVSGLSADMRTLRQSDSADAQRALAMFVHRIRREAGALVAVLQGLDVLSFSGGIGENDAATRAEVCAGLGHLGVRLDEAANRAITPGQPCPVHAHDSAVAVWVVPTDEALVAARAALALLA
ncbi:MAG: hypothetical protein RIQ97_596 [Pseudomonadota bacterium]|jgi:acetate kinase